MLIGGCRLIDLSCWFRAVRAPFYATPGLILISVLAKVEPYDVFDV